jgi:threonine synthase
VSDLPSSLVCSGCGAAAHAEDAYPFRCPNAGRADDVDHVLVRLLDVHALAWPYDEIEPNPFLRYRSLLRSSHLARARGMGDDEVRRVITGLDDRLAEIDGHGFRVTPYARSDELSGRLGFAPEGGVWVKDETVNVSGSHKARHLMGLALHLEMASRLGLTGPGPQPALAIASCGNAALAAAVVARAAGRTLEVFVPTDADPAVVMRVKELDAQITTCPREEGASGDPTHHRLRKAIAAGALPFTCQGSENGLAIEGGETLGWEIVDELRATKGRLDRVIVQVGGGALATAVARSFQEATALGALPVRPRIDTVQTLAAFPLQRAFERVAARTTSGEGRVDALRYAATHRSEFMWPWEAEPRSIAGGILDDETYDWLAVVDAMLATGGSPLVADEDLLEHANALGRACTGIDVDHTGTAGLAGLLALVQGGTVRTDERVAVLFTGVRRT